jgi:hypothetical protein
MKNLYIGSYYPLRIIFLIGIVGGGVQLGPLGTTATNKPIVPAPVDYDKGEIGGMMIGRGNRSTKRKPASVPLCPPQTPHACTDANPGRRVANPAPNRLSYGTALPTKNLYTHFNKYADRRIRKPIGLAKACRHNNIKSHTVYTPTPYFLRYTQVCILSLHLL